MMRDTLPVVFLVGPTAIGKSRVAISVAKALGTEILTADSTQVYRGMDIGTDKPTPAEREGVPHRLIDLVEPDEPFNVGLYRRLVLQEIARLHAEGRVPLVVGRPLPAAKEQLAAQPLGARLVFKPAKAGRRPGMVVNQLPRRGYLSAGENVILIVTKAQHGVLPDFVGSSVDEARARLARLKIEPAITFGEGRPGTVVSQKPSAGVAAAPGLSVQLVVARG